MTDGIFINLLIWAYYISRTASVFIFLALGVVITANRYRPTKVLGISYIITSVSAILSLFLSVFQHFGSAEMYSSLQTASSVVMNLCSIGVNVCICLYIHKNYGMKKIYFPVFIMLAVSWIINMVIIAVVNHSDMDGSNRGFVIAVLMNVAGLVFSVASSVIIIRAFYVNQQKEKAIPKYWLLSVITLFWSAFTSSLNIINYLVLMQKYGSNGTPNPTGIAGFWLTNQNIIFTLTGIAGAAISLIIPIYIVRMIHRVNKAS